MPTWIPSLVWMGVIYYFSSRTASELRALFPFIPDFNWGHLIAYFILAVFYYYPLQKRRSLRPGFWAVLLSLAYGFTDEYHQSFVPGRQPDLRDLGADFLGALLAIVVIKWLCKKQKKRKMK